MSGLTPEDQAHLNEMERRLDQGETWKPEIKPILAGGHGPYVAKVKDYAVKHADGSPVSRSLPRRKGGKITTEDGHVVKQHKDGGFTDLQGRPIVRTKRERERELKRSGLIEDPGDPR